MKSVPQAVPNMIPCKKINPPMLRVLKLDKINPAAAKHTPNKPVFFTPYFEITQDA
jgi:hypothetical protein